MKKQRKGKNGVKVKSKGSLKDQRSGDHAGTDLDDKVTFFGSTVFTALFMGMVTGMATDQWFYSPAEKKVAPLILNTLQLSEYDLMIDEFFSEGNVILHDECLSLPSLCDDDAAARTLVVQRQYKRSLLWKPLSSSALNYYL